MLLYRCYAVLYELLYFMGCRIHAVYNVDCNVSWVDLGRSPQQAMWGSGPCTTTNPFSTHGGSLGCIGIKLANQSATIYVDEAKDSLHFLLAL